MLVIHIILPVHIYTVISTDMIYTKSCDCSLFYKVTFKVRVRPSDC